MRESAEQAQADFQRTIAQERLAFHAALPPATPIPTDRGRVALNWMPSASRLLDLGCSTGHHLLYLRHKAQQVIGVDIEPVALSLAAQRVQRPNVTYIRCDAVRMPFASGTFDVVTSLDVLEHVPNRGAMVREIARLLQPGGSWIVSVPHRGMFHRLSPENLAKDFPIQFRRISQRLHVQFWIREHNNTQRRHRHFAAGQIETLAAEYFELARLAPRGWLLYPLAYLALCFPLRCLKRARWWVSLCYGLMALDYLIPYGRFSYNLVMQFRRRAASDDRQRCKQTCHVDRGRRITPLGLVPATKSPPPEA